MYAHSSYQTMKLYSILGIISFLCLTTTMAQKINWSKQGCQDKCGNVTIAYPFGIGAGCSANSSFAITCNSSGPFLSGINREVVNISVQGTVTVKQPVSPMGCSAEQKTGSLPLSLRGSPFTISARYNSLAVLGCTNSVWLLVNGSATVGGCMAICGDNANNNNRTRDYSCSGLNCCKSPISQPLQDFLYSYRSIQNSNGNFCGYAFPVDKKWFPQDYGRYRGLVANQSYPYDQEFVSAPLVLEWEVDLTPSGRLVTCRYADNYRYSSSVNEYDDPSASLYYIYYDGYEHVSSTRYCSCVDGYEGNPYVEEGCVDINECELNQTITYPTCTGGICTNATVNRYCGTGTCINKIGGYTCDYNDTNSKSKTAFISVGSAAGALVLLAAVWKSWRVIRKRVKAKRRQEFFKRNGGLLLQQQLSSTDNTLDKAKLFNYKELAQATDHYNENRILGHGGQGTVYKGMLTDGKIVAVKKSKKVEEGDLEAFINEVVILSQVNHRNVVRLLGCCLETEVPLLVYEFVPNGTLFQLIHEPSEEFPLTWKMRVRIAREVAGALAYLHSAASTPIYHRDIKSTNILLDEKYRSKVSDFGASRSVSIDQTHLTTRVLGTFGYLDPEYFQSSQFTEKSDVYSFGVVMVELLTGEKAISSVRSDEVGRSLATHFLHSMEEDGLFEIVDERVVKEGKKEEIVKMAQLAGRCLHLNGKRRPTMKEVAMGLEGIQMEGGSSIVWNQECEAVEVEESYDFSSVTGSMHFDGNSTTAYSQEDHRRLLD